MTIRTLLRIVAWALLLGLIVVTLSPIEFRPISPLPVQVERATALAVVGFVFALAYPRHIVIVALIVLGSTVLLEALQLVAPSRHGRLVDLGVKLVGGAIGLGIGTFVARRLPAIKHRGQ